MTYSDLFHNICNKKSFLCVGLDSSTELIPDFLKDNEYPLFDFNKSIIDATAQYAVAFKPNVAFYEAEGVKGWIQFEMTVDYIKSQYPDIMVIADAKRGDIGNTAKKYAQAFFTNMKCDAVTLAPYMGEDSVRPFLDVPDKWSVVLALTSNNSAVDFETTKSSTTSVDGYQMPMFERIIRKAMTWGNYDNTMFVVGATRPEKLGEIRSYCPDHFFLVPGVGAQGGTISDVAKYGLNSHCGLLVNSSRGIIYASHTEDFAKVAAEEAHKMAQEMSKYLY